PSSSACRRACSSVTPIRLLAFRRASRNRSRDRSGIKKHRVGGGPSISLMTITIHSSFLPHTDPEASLAFYRDVLDFEVRLDVGYEGMRWITVGPKGQPDTAIVLHPPTALPGLTDE